MIVAKVLKLHKYVRPPLAQRGHQLVDERVVVVARDAALLEAGVEGVGEECLVVGANVEADRQARVRVHACDSIHSVDRTHL